MNWLKMYVSPASANAAKGGNTFYSRRANGPYYRWNFEEKLGQWRFSRVLTSDLVPSELCTANWKSVPPALQLRLGEHYLE